MKLVKISLLIFVSFFYLNMDCNGPTPVEEIQTTITGKVIDAETKLALQGTAISTEPPTEQTSTDDGGKFVIDLNVEVSQRYKVNTFLSGYIPNFTEITVKKGTNTTSDIPLHREKPILKVSPTVLDFGINQTSRLLTIENSGTSELNWAIKAPSESWLSLIGTLSGTITNHAQTVEVKVNRSNLASGIYTATLVVTSNGGNSSIEVSMGVPNPNAPQLYAYPANLDFKNYLTQLTLYIQNIGSSQLDWTLSTNESWVKISNTVGNTTTEIDEILVIAFRDNLTKGNYNGKITINSDGGNQIISVSIEVSDDPVLSYNPNSLDFGLEHDKLTFQIQNVGGNILTWSLFTNEKWIQLDPASGTNDDVVTVMVDRTNQSEGAHNGIITITSNGGNGQVSVNMEGFPDDPPTAVVLDEPTEITINSMKLGWSQNNDPDFVSYNLYRSTAPNISENSTKIVTFNARETRNYTDTGLSPNTTYYYKIYVMDQGQKSTGSNVVSGKTKAILGNWMLVKNYPGIRFNDIAILSQNNIYFVGHNDYHTFIYHWDGSIFHEEYLPANTKITHMISFSSVNDGWAVGYDGQILRYNGQSWTKYEESPTTEHIYAVKALAYNDVWIGTVVGKIYHYHNNNWNEISINSYGIKDLCFLSDSSGWSLDQNGKIFYYNGVGWVFVIQLDVKSAAFGFNYEIDLISNSYEGWVCGNHDSWDEYLYHFDGINWNKYQNDNHPAKGVLTIDMITSSNVWAAGTGGNFYHYNGDYWEQVSSPTNKSIYELKMTDSTDGWAVGDDGVILRYR